MPTIFESPNHFEYLKNRLQASERGLKAKFAEALQIQPAFLSQVLAQKYALSLEQADRANAFFDHSSEEAAFFFLLVSRDRAGTPSLKRHFENQIKGAIGRQAEVVGRMGRQMEVSEKAKAIYYSRWQYSAIHVACTVERLRTRKALAKELHLPLEFVGTVLDFLQDSGLLVKTGEEYHPTKSWVRLDRGSEHIVKHHSNWRLRAMENMTTQADSDLHYSGVYSLDEEAASRVRKILLDTLAASAKEIEKAKEQSLHAIGLDFFRLK